MSNTEHVQGLSGRFRHAIVLTVLFALQMQSVAPAWSQQTVTAPSQVPLLSRDGKPPKPNVMLTLDTSWSMIFPYAPEGKFKRNPNDTYEVWFPGFTSVIMHPNDPRHDQGAAVVIQRSPTVVDRYPAASVGDGGVIPADPGNIRSANPKILPIQMRSPDVNTIYYDPRVRYRPWLESKDTETGAETRYCDANPKQAFFTPKKDLKRIENSTVCAFSAEAAASKALADQAADLTQVTSSEAHWCETVPTQAMKLSCVKDSRSFNPGLYFLLNQCTTTPNANNAGCYTQYNINDMDQCAVTSNGTKTTPCFPKYPGRTDCSGTSCTQDEERQNFANWFVYYRTRLHVAQASIPEALLQNPGSIRLGWGTIHSTSTVVDGGLETIPFVQQGVRNFDTTIKSNMVDWIRNFSSDKTVDATTSDPKLRGGTPLRLAMLGVGNYFARRGKGSPWAQDPTGPAPAPNDPPDALACRRSYHVLVTDGYYNDADASVTAAMKQSMAYLTRTSTTDDTFTGNTCPRGESGACLSDAEIIQQANQDNTTGFKINGIGNSYTYQPAAPFQDNLAYTLADAAMLFWKNDLHPTSRFPNIVPAGGNSPEENPAFWQHLVQFPIGLGVKGSLDVSDWPKLIQTATGTPGNAYDWWQGATAYDQVEGSSPLRVDDLVHAAINSRGRYFRANNAGDLSQAIETALSLTEQQPGNKESGVALNVRPAKEYAGELKLVPEYATRAWTGDIKAYSLDSFGAIQEPPAWAASELLPSPVERKIYTSIGAGGTVGARFTWADTKEDETYIAALSTNLPAGASAEDVVNYIRGDKSKEGTLLRSRSGKLPDFINSTPVFVKDNVNLRYEQLAVSPSNNQNYTAFLAKKAARFPVLFMGSNGGMVHAFAITAQDADGIAAGKEIYAYVPRGVVPKLGLLARKDYGTSTNNIHQALVDGPQVETDAFVDGTWHNLLVGTLGAGGKGLYAIKIPTDNPKNLNANSVFLDITSDDLGTTGDDMGYMMGAPQVGVLPDGRWMLFVGNGPYSKNGQAKLIAINLADKSVTTYATDSATANGLGAVTLVKNTKQQVIGIYAGDLKGNIWRFPITTPPGSNNTTATSSIGAGVKLFTARHTAAVGTANHTQPITAAPAVVPHPRGGYMVVVGTGKLYDTGDNDNTDVQTLYGLWDKLYREDGSGASAFKADVLRDAVLVKQTVTPAPLTATDGSIQGTYFVSSQNEVDYSKQDVLGWYMDLTLSAGQRLVYESTVIGSYVLLNTVAPAPEITTESCERSKGKGYNYLLPALTGAMSKKAILDTNGDGLVNGSDLVTGIFQTGVKGKGGGADGGDSVTLREPAPNPDPCSGIAGTIHDTADAQNFVLPGCTNTIKSRIWRQLVNPPRP